MGTLSEFTHHVAFLFGPFRAKRMRAGVPSTRVFPHPASSTAGTQGPDPPPQGMLRPQLLTIPRRAVSPTLSLPLGESSRESMGQWARGMGMVGGTLVPVGGTLSLQAGIIKICKAYANHPEERHDSEETLKMIQPIPPPPFTGEEQRPHQEGTCSRSFRHLGNEEGAS